MLYDYIAECDARMPNVIEYEQKKKWLDRLESEMRIELGDLIPSDAEIVGVPPYDDVYVEYLKMKCAEAVGDVNRFNNYFSLFSDRRDKLYAYYARTYKSKGAKWKNVL